MIMKKIFLLIAGISILYVAGCEQPLEEEDFPYELKLVVRSIVKTNRLIDSIYVGRTLPVSVPFNEEFSKVTTAVGAVVSEGVFYPLRHKGNGYYTTDSLIARSGRTYSLIVNWESISINAQTTVPVIGSLNGTYVDQGIENGRQFNFLEGIVTPFSNEVYGATWFLMSYAGFINQEASEFAKVVKKNSNEQVVYVPTIEIPQSFNTYNGSYGIRLFAYDAPFYDYYITSGTSQVADAIFGQSGTNVKWNIYGQGIGMFVGTADTIIVVGTN